MPTIIKRDNMWPQFGFEALICSVCVSILLLTVHLENSSNIANQSIKACVLGLVVLILISLLSYTKRIKVAYILSLNDELIPGRLSEICAVVSALCALLYICLAESFLSGFSKYIFDFFIGFGCLTVILHLQSLIYWWYLNKRWRQDEIVEILMFIQFGTSPNIQQQRLREADKKCDQIQQRISEHTKRKRELSEFAYSNMLDMLIERHDQVLSEYTACHKDKPLSKLGRYYSFGKGYYKELNI